MGGDVRLIDKGTGKAYAFPEAEAEVLLRSESTMWAPETAEGQAERTIGARIDEDYSGIGDKAIGAFAGGLRGLTMGGSDALARLVDPDLARDLGRIRKANPILSTTTEVGGALGAALASGGVGGAGAAARLTPTGFVAARSTALARAGSSTLGKIGAAGAAGAGEAVVQAAGGVASDLVLGDLDVDRLASEFGHRALYAGLFGGGTGAVLRGLEVAVGKAARATAATRDAAQKAGAVPEELAGLDKKALRTTEAAEHARIEAERVPQRAQVADEIAAFREATKRDQPWVALATGSKQGKKAARAAAAVSRAAEIAGEAPIPRPASAPRWVREAEKVYVEADKYLDRVLRNPKALAQRPGRALDALQQQEAALETVTQRADELRALHATDRGTARADALLKVPAALEKNRALQRRIADLAAPPSSPLLAGIADARDALDTVKEKSLGQKILGGVVYSAVTGAVGSSVPVVGHIAAPFLGSMAADKVSDILAGKFASATAASAARTASAVESFLGAARASHAAPVLASKVLADARFAPEQKDTRPELAPKTSRSESLEASFEKRSAEIASATMPTPDGPRVRPEARQAIARRLAGVAAVAPHVADRLETHAVRRLEFLAKRVPKLTQIGMTRIPPSELAIRAWARYVAAADDPGAIEERLAAGTVTPEDAEIMRELYPERMAHIVRTVIEKMATLRKTLPYERRIALSIFTDAPVDASCDPAILDVLQTQHAQEAGTEGGTQAPKPQAAMGSIKKSAPEPTAAQARAG